MQINLALVKKGNKETKFIFSKEYRVTPLHACLMSSPHRVTLSLHILIRFIQSLTKLNSLKDLALLIIIFRQPLAVPLATF